MNGIGIFGRILGVLEWRRPAQRLLIGAAVSLVLATGAQAATDLGAEDKLPPVAHADRDGDGLSDALQNKIDGKGAGEKIAVVVVFDGPGNAATTKAAVGPFAVKRTLTTIRGFAATMTVGQARALAGTPGIFRVEEDFVATINMVEARADYGADAAQAYGYDGSGVAVCVIDTGLDPNHLDLAGKIDGFCDALAGGCTVDADGLATDNTAPFDDHGHGTHVGGIAAGAGIGQSQYRGVAPAARLYGAKVCNSAGGCSLSAIEAGIGWCAGQGAVRVMNISIGTAGNGDGSSAMSLAADCAVDPSSHPGICIDYPLRTPKIIVVAAGNAGAFLHTVGEPGAAREVISVGALGTASVAAEWADRRGHGVVAFSSRGPTADHRIKPDITAPGAGITAPKADITGSGITDGYQTFSGTSMASPFTAGTMALMIQARLQSMSRPPTDPLDATDVVQLKNALYNTAQDRGPAGQDDDWGHGAIDTYNAVLTAGGNPPAPNTFATTEFFTPLIDDASDWNHLINVAPADVGKSLLVTILNPSFDECLGWVGGECWFWSVITTDFDVLLWDPNGILIDMSACPGGENPDNGSMDPADPTVTYCGGGSQGRQETVYTTTDTAGAYTLRIFPWNGDGYDNVPSATPEVVIALSGSAASAPDTTVPIVTAGANQIGDEGATVGVDATFTDATAGDTHSATIDWGDGTSNTIINPAISPLAPSHVYADNGSYTVTITVTDAANNSHGDTLAVTVNNVAPTVNAGADKTAQAGTQFTINPTFTDPGSADTHSAVVIWGDGAVDTVNPATSPLSLNHTYTNPATTPYSVSVTVTDKDGDAHTDTLSVTVGVGAVNQPPVGDAGPDQGIVLPKRTKTMDVTLDGSASSDPDDGIAGYAWTWAGGGATGVSPTVNLPIGVTIVTLTVTDGVGATDTDTVCIDLYRKNPSGTCGGGNAVPVVTIADPANGAAFASGTLIQFTGSADDAEDGDVTGTLVWTSSLDGTIGSGGSFTTILSDGNHTITATATDTSTATGNQSVDITIGATGGGGTVSVSSITFSVKGKGLNGTVTVDPAVSAVGVEVSFCREGVIPCTFDHFDEATNGKGQAKFKIVGFTSGYEYTLTVHSLTVNGTTTACNPSTETCVATITP